MKETKFTPRVGWFIKCKGNGQYKEIRKIKDGEYLLGLTASTKQEAKTIGNDGYWNIDGITNVLGTHQEPFGKSIKEHVPKVNFLLQYELDEDPIEEFETMKQVNDRLKELAGRSDLKRDSIVLYEIKAKKTVKLTTQTRISIKAA